MACELEHVKRGLLGTIPGRVSPDLTSEEKRGQDDETRTAGGKGEDEMTVFRWKL